MRVYIAGPMGGYEHFNYPAFIEAEAALHRDQASWIERIDNALSRVPDELLIFEVINPVKNCENPSDGFNWNELMRTAIRQVCLCDAVVVLPGWSGSRGATREVKVADYLDIPVFDFELGLRVSAEAFCVKK